MYVPLISPASPKELLKLLEIVLIKDLFQVTHPPLHIVMPLYLCSVHVEISYDTPQVSQLSWLQFEELFNLVCRSENL